MLGAIIGDIVGSRFEFNNTHKIDFELFTPECSYTDDTICTIAIADAICKGIDYRDSLLHWCRKYSNPMGGYGGSFAQWIHSSNPQPYNSFGNGSAMRVSPIGWAFDDIKDVLTEAKKTAKITHDHPEGIKGAQVVAELIFKLRNGGGKDYPVSSESVNGYTLIDGLYYEIPTMDEIRSTYHYNETCQGTVPQALRCFLDANSFEETIRLAISIGGDSDTIGAIAGSIAEAYYPIPSDIRDKVFDKLPTDMLKVIGSFYEMLNNKNIDV